MNATSLLDRPEWWIWMELRSLNSSLPDFGLDAYLEQTGFVPDAVSILISAPDFVHHHSGIDDEVVFPQDFCSYNGHMDNSIIEPPVWTNHMLKGLVDALHARGISAYFSVFTTDIGDRFRREWIRDHEYLLEFMRDGSRITRFNVLKHLQDGSLYEDFVIPKIVEVLEDYNFDGWHAIDGWGPLRRPVYKGDFSQDMVAQFAKHAGLSMPPEFVEVEDSHIVAVGKRADWILTNYPAEWREFYTDRWVGFYTKAVHAVHSAGKKLLLNSAWTRDPFEAIWRYGFDYRKVALTGVDGYMAETVAPATFLDFGVNSHFDNLASLMLMRASLPQETRLLFLNGVRDTVEQWDVLSHNRSALERDLFTFAGMRIMDASGGFQPCTNGPLTCLGFSVGRDEWAMLRDTWGISASDHPVRPIGATVVWSHEALWNQVRAFAGGRRLSTFGLMQQLMESGAPIVSVVRSEDVASASGVLLLLLPETLPAKELEAVLHSGQTVITIGSADTSLPGPDFSFQSGGMACSVYGCKPKWQPESASAEDSCITDYEEPFIFPERLRYLHMPAGFLKNCSSLITCLTGAPQVIEKAESTWAAGFEQQDGSRRLIVINNLNQYSWPLLRFESPVVSARRISVCPASNPLCEGSTVRVKVPPRGAAIISVECGRE